MSDHDDHEVVCIPIPLTPETVRRLQALSDICHADPVKVAASLLRDILADDEEAHFLENAVPPSNVKH
jgi:hypothetical protein